MNIIQLQKHKRQNKPIAMLTCYDTWSAKLIDQQQVDCVLVGDTVAMVMHGYDSTVYATPEMMVMHTQAVSRGLTKPLLVADMPFMSYRQGFEHAIRVATQLMQAGAQAIKLEGAKGNEKIIRHLVESGIPVMGHLGLTPQSVHQLGGHKVQGKDQASAGELKQDALDLQSWGCFAMVLECMPEELAQQVTQSLTIPVIGIGAGRYVDGQVLVLQDMLGLAGDFNPKFLQTFADGEKILSSGIHDYCLAVKSQQFPAEKHVYPPYGTAEVQEEYHENTA